MPNKPRPTNPARPVRIEDGLWSVVQTIAAEDETTPSEVVREAVRRYTNYTLADDALVAATRYAECHEEVSRGGESQPCNKVAVAVRLDPRDGEPYPVCGYHARADMVPLRALAATLDARR